MKWSDISSLVGEYAPLVGGLVGGPAGASIGSVISAALGTDNKPEAVANFISEKPEQARAALGELQERNKHQYEMMLLEMQKTAIHQQALTARAEIKSGDKFVARWRPTFGYMLALSFFIFSSAFAYLLIQIIKSPTSMAEVVSSVSQLMGPVSVIWSMALAVLGINVHSRSKDKQTEAGKEPEKGFLASLFSKGK